MSRGEPARQVFPQLQLAGPLGSHQAHRLSCFAEVIMRVLLLSFLVVACSGQDITVRLCCPEGHAYKENPDYDYDAWDYNDPSTHPRTCQEHSNKEELVYGGPGVRLEGDTKFKCPPFTFEVGGNEEGDGLIEQIQLLPSGDLKVSLNFDMT